MTNQSWQTLSQIVVVIGLLLTALGGYGAYHFGKLVEQEKDAKSAYTGELKVRKKLLLSGTEHVWPKIEFGDSGAILLYAGPTGSPLFTFADDTKLTIVREGDSVKVSLLIRDKTGAVVAELQKNEWKVNPHRSWDRNYSRDALEVIDETGDVVLQVKALQDRVQLQAKFYDSHGRGFAFGKTKGPDGVGGGMEFTGPAHPVLTMKFARMFAYPSDRHLGEMLGFSGAT